MAGGAVPGGSVVARHLDWEGGHGGEVHVEGDGVGGGGVQGGHARRPQLGGVVLQGGYWLAET